jgi:hypothetical protein
MNTDLPKKIWFLWLQGLDDAPLVIKKCYESWVKHNPGWELILLDESSIGEYIPFNSPNITKQALSDILRINLLAQHGGVWVDATCFCMKPLDGWLYDNMSTGFFAFNKPGPDRMIASWFIACNKYNFIATTYQKLVNSYWTENPKLTFIEDSGWRFLNKKLSKMSTQVWFSPLVTNTLKVYPYFWFHYMFANAYLRLKSFREQWDSTPKISADIPHSLQFAGLLNTLTPEVKQEIDSKTAPVYKLTWKYELQADLTGSILAYLHG